MEDIPWPIGETLSATIGPLSPGAIQTVSLSQSFRCVFPSGLNPAPNAMRVDQAYVVIDKIILRVRNPDGTPGNPTDWLTLDDFAQRGNYGATNTSRYVNSATNDYGQLNYSPNYPFANSGYVTRPIDAVASPTPAPGFSAGNALGLAKNDPRVRFPTGVWGTTNGSFRPNGFSDGLMAWRRVAGGGGGAPNLTLGSQNSVFSPSGTNGVVTGVSYLDPDPVPAGISILNHSHFTRGYTVLPPPAGVGLRSVAQLGSIHTGLPWRTLRFLPTATNELNQGPPDWVLLDAFAATNPTTPMPQINLNGVVASLQSSNSTNLGLPVASDGQVQTRPWALLGAMGALVTNLSVSDTNFYTSNGIPESLRTNPLARYGSNGLRQIALNLGTVLNNPNVAGSGWASGSAWPSTRASRSSNFPANGLALKGELLEVRGVAVDASLGEDVLEGRLRGFMDTVTTRSDTFSVWSVGQGLLVITNAQGQPIRTNVMGEIRKQTVFQREPVINGGVVTGYRYRTVYSRGHVVE